MRRLALQEKNDEDSRNLARRRDAPFCIGAGLGAGRRWRADLIKQNRIAVGSRAEIGRSPLVIGIRAGAPRGDISNAETLKRRLLQAKSITYPQDGASRGYIEKVFGELGITADLKPKIVLAAGSGPATQSVAEGRQELVLTLASETAPVPGVEVLGPFPGKFAYDIYFAGAASSATTHGEAVKALLAFLKGRQASAVFRAKGVEGSSPAK